MRYPFSLFLTGTRQAGPSGNATPRSAGRNRHTAPPARTAYLLGLLLLAGTASASVPENGCSEETRQSLRNEAKQAMSDNDLPHLTALMKTAAECRQRHHVGDTR